MPAPDLETLRAFRTALHACFDRRGDALIELTDALRRLVRFPRCRN